LKFIHPRKGPMSPEQMVEDIRTYIERDKSARYKIVLGRTPRRRTGKRCL